MAIEKLRRDAPTMFEGKLCRQCEAELRNVKPLQLPYGSASAVSSALIALTEKTTYTTEVVELDVAGDDARAPMTLIAVTCDKCRTVRLVQRET